MVSIPTMRPGRAESTATRSEMNTDSAIEWVTNRTVVASGSHRRARRWRMSARVISSRAANGSSIKSSGAPSATARTRATRCCMPPDSSCGYAPAKSERPTWASSSEGVGPSGVCARRRLTSRSRRAFASTVRHGSRAGDCGTKPMRFSDRATWGLDPSTDTVPAVGSTSPPTMRRSVVLPLPDGPSTVTISPDSIVRSTGPSASTVPNRCATPASSMAAVTGAERTADQRGSGEACAADSLARSVAARVSRRFGAMLAAHRRRA